MTGNVRIRYSKVEESGNRKNTLVTIREGDTIYFGIAMCNLKKDVFTKDMGIKIATGRAEAAKGESANSELRGAVNFNNIKDLLEYFDSIDEKVLCSK